MLLFSSEKTRWRQFLVFWRSVDTVEPPNNGHIGDEHFVHWSEVVTSSGVETYGQYIGRG